MHNPSVAAEFRQASGAAAAELKLNSVFAGPAEPLACNRHYLQTLIPCLTPYAYSSSRCFPCGMI